jgi:ABC-type protease/lipase transport system fused ATPase/permease subunit
VEQAIGAWKGFVLARDAWKDLNKTDDRSVVGEVMELPQPQGHVVVDALSYQPNPQRPAILDDISFSIKPGEVLCLIGPSGSGKTTLSRMLVGAASPTSGEVRLDERAVTGWSPAQFGQHVGYLPQGVEMLPGSLKDNIQRFGEDDPEGVMKAARVAQVDDLIRNLPDGYETQIETGGPSPLSAGQLQRVALARALYGSPKLVVLDEPNANLDVEGEHALFTAVRKIAEEGASVVIVSHRPALLEAADQVAVVRGGRMVAKGPREEILMPKGAMSSKPRKKREPRIAPFPVAAE